MPRSILLVDAYYRAVLQDHGLTDAPDSHSPPYAERLREALDIGFGTSPAYAAGLRALGWQADVVVANSLALQGTWARDHEQPVPWSQAWAYGNHLARLPAARSILHRLPHVQGTLLRQVQSLRPDVVYVHDINLIPPRMVRELRRHAGLVVGEHASPLPPRSYVQSYDLLVSALPTIVDRARQWGVDAEWIPLGYDDRWVTSGPVSERPIDAIFVGSFTRLQPTTAPLLRAVGEAVPGLQIYGQADQSVLEQSGLARYHRGPAWGREMYELLGRSKIVVNRHGSIAGDYAVNMRMYEATGSGAALVTERKSNLADLFEPGVEVETYSSVDEAARVVSSLLADPTRLDALAAAGQA
ncbi:MAG: glycosyltransferase, partial [Pseudolysinimonas sp.]